MIRSMKLGALASLGVTLLVSSHALAIGVAARANRPYPVGVPIEFAANGVGEGELKFTWDFGDGTQSEPDSSGRATHTYEKPGHYSVIVLLEDSTGTRSDSFIQTVHRPLPPVAPTSSSTIVHLAAQKRVCNVNADNDTISCVSTETLELLFEAAVGDHPRTLALGPDGNLWVTNQDDATISVVTGDGAPVATIPLPRASMPFGIAMHPTRAVAYVALQARGEIAEIDIQTREVKRIGKALPFAAGVAVEPNQDRIYVTRLISASTGAEVVELDAETLARTETFPLAVNPGPDTEATARGVPNYLRAVVPNPDLSALWVPSKQDNILRGEARDGIPLTFETTLRSIISRIDLTERKELLDRRIDLNNRALGLSLTFSPVGDYAFLAFLGNNGVNVIDTYNGNQVAGAFDQGKAPDGLVLDDAGRLYVNAFMSRAVDIFDASNVLASKEFELKKIAQVVVSKAEKLAPNVLLGKTIFYDASDTRMSRHGYISCASCHLDGFEDGQVWDFTDRGEGLRNTTSLMGKRGNGQGPLHWSANFDEVQDFEHDIRGPFEGTGFLPDELFNEGTRNTTLGDKKEGKSEELDALAAYVTSLDRVNPSPHRDPDGSLTDAGFRGLEIFLASGCADCHSGPDFTDSAKGVRHDVGTITPMSGMRLGGELDGIDTPTLRGLWETAPYLHDGSAATLLEVISTRNPDDRHGKTSHLSAAELADLEAYLLQIDNTPLEDEAALEPEGPAEPGEPGEPSDPGKPGEPGGPGEPGEPGEPNEPKPPATTSGGGCSVGIGAPSHDGLLWLVGLFAWALGSQSRKRVSAVRARR